MIDSEQRLRIDRLATTLRWGPAGAGHGTGLDLAGRLGRAGEFEEYRPWRPGDELSALDAGVYRRLRRRVARVDREDSSLPLTILVDRSASMAAAPRDRCIRELVVFFLALARARKEPRRLLFLEGGNCRSIDLQSDLETHFNLLPTGKTLQLGRALERVPTDGRGRGRVVLLCDGFDVTDEQLLSPLLPLGRTLWIAPWTQEELSPTIRGAVRLHSSESEPQWFGAIDEELIDRYRSRLRQRWRRIESWLRERGGDALHYPAEEGWEGAIQRSLNRGRWLRR